MKKTTKKTKPFIEEKEIATLSCDEPNRSVIFGQRTYDHGEVMYTITELNLKGWGQIVELKRPELTELLVKAFDLLKSPKLIHDLKMPTEMKQ